MAGDEMLYAATVLGLVIVAVTFFLQQASSSKVELPGNLPPQGETTMLESDLGGEEESEEAVPDEVARDFTRTFLASGGHIKLLTSNSLTAMEALDIGMREFAGNVNKEVTDKVIDSFKAFVEAALATAKVDKIPSNLYARILRLLTVSPGMKVVLDHQVMPALYQPKFLVALAGEADKVPEVRVVTFAFVGGPPAGPPDPSKKYSPFRICMVSDNLLVAPSAASAPKTVATVKFNVKACTDTSMEDVVGRETGYLQEAVTGGAKVWANYLAM